ncbi:hypothetical protein SAMN04488238_1103 [Roseicitreum antarcticum]|uniref:O-antigen ligase-related domain-containing protein n=2 Tax=Roseicitreum antarcticum TaxID=564137 RepID=A0A1H3CNT9_9RHOB|nr:hypothetical protein SAMN04488238_1103 [Roseicitreum antarcticum]
MVLGISLASMMLLQVFGQGNLIFIQMSSMLILVVALLIAVSYKPTHSVASIVTILIVSFSFVLILSSFRSYEVLGSGPLVRAVAIVVFMGIGFLFAQRRGHNILERSFPVCAVALIFVLIFVLVDGDRHFARLTGHLHSNLWGFVASTLLVGVIYANIRLVSKILLIATSLYLLAFEFQTRGAFLFGLVFVSIFSGIEIISAIKKSPNSIFGYSVLSIILSVVIIALFLVTEYILVEILQTQSATRGLDSGLSGRTEIWRHYLNIYTERPIFGFGFDMSRFYAETYFRSEVGGEISSAHNSYITILFDFGLVGASLYFVLLFLVLIGSLRMKSLMFFAFVLIVLISGLTESRPLNVGNSAGIIFVFLIPYCAASAFSSQNRAVSSKRSRSLSDYKSMKFST